MFCLSSQEDGSFSAFGHFVDRRGSVWITALTASAFRQADPFINVDQDVISAALSWLVKSQAANGSFPEIGPMTYKLVQDDPISTTAYVVLSFYDNKQKFETLLIIFEFKMIQS
jgi:CD109 antigen